MLQKIINKLTLPFFLTLIIFTLIGCKKNKEIALKAAHEAKIKNEVEQLLNYLLNDNELSWETIQEQLNKIKINLPNQSIEVDEKIDAIQNKINNLQIKEDEERRNEEERASVLKAKEKSLKLRLKALDERFKNIAEADNNHLADKMILETLNLFNSPKTPLLIIIFEQGDQKDYDKPTKVNDYLNYLKDQKKYINKVVNIEYNEKQKINLIELKKIH